MDGIAHRLGNGSSLSRATMCRQVVIRRLTCDTFRQLTCDRPKLGAEMEGSGLRNCLIKTPEVNHLTCGQVAGYGQRRDASSAEPLGRGSRGEGRDRASRARLGP